MIVAHVTSTRAPQPSERLTGRGLCLGRVNTCRTFWDLESPEEMLSLRLLSFYGNNHYLQGLSATKLSNINKNVQAFDSQDIAGYCGVFSQRKLKWSVKFPFVNLGSEPFLELTFPTLFCSETSVGLQQTIVEKCCFLWSSSIFSHRGLKG